MEKKLFKKLLTSTKNKKHFFPYPGNNTTINKIFTVLLLMVLTILLMCYHQNSQQANRQNTKESKELYDKTNGRVVSGLFLEDKLFMNQLILHKFPGSFLFAGDFKTSLLGIKIINSLPIQYSWGFIIVFVCVLTFIAILVYFYTRNLIKKKDSELEKQMATMHLQISLAEKYIEEEKAKQKELENEVEFKNKQLTSYAFSFEQKNRIIDQLQEIVKKIDNSATTIEKKQFVKELKAVAKENLAADKNWDCFRNFFQETQFGFHAKLLAKHPDLKANDLKLCSVIRLNLTIKETADVLGISAGSLKTSRYRLRKKMSLPAKQDIIDYLINFEIQDDTPKVIQRDEFNMMKR